MSPRMLLWHSGDSNMDLQDPSVLGYAKHWVGQLSWILSHGAEQLIFCYQAVNNLFGRTERTDQALGTWFHLCPTFVIDSFQA